MKTRRSPRNQEILWKALGGKGEETIEPVYIPRCWDCCNYPKGGRGRGECTLRGDMVRGITENRKCFIKRKEAPDAR